MNYPIPARLNIIIIVACTVMFFCLFAAGSYFTQFSVRVLLGLIFSIVMIPVYSLMHEGAHNSLHPSPLLNYWLSRWLCSMFNISFTFYRHCHLKHHKKNRTDEEMWDLYYEHQNKWLRYGNLYLMLIGLGYLAICLSVVLFSISPKLVISSFFRNHTEANGFLNGFNLTNKLKTAQLESIFVIVFQLLLFWLIKWDLSLWAIFYLIHGLVWSSQNYVNHAFSPRDIINGAHNLKIPKWLNIIYLNFNIHLAHHQNPNIPWLHLPSFIRSDKGRFSFFRNYVRLWKGPRLTQEKSPVEINS